MISYLYELFMSENSWLDTTIISAITSTISSIVVYYLGIKNTRKEKLRDDRDNILKISVEYPYLEYPVFCDSWDKSKAKHEHDEAEKFIRYEMYTILVFNHLSDVCNYYNYDLKKITKNHVDIKNWLRLHRKIWKEPLTDEYANTDGYNEKFVSFVNKIWGCTR